MDVMTFSQPFDFEQDNAAGGDQESQAVPSDQAADQTADQTQSQPETEIDRSDKFFLENLDAIVAVAGDDYQIPEHQRQYIDAIPRPLPEGVASQLADALYIDRHRTLARENAEKGEIDQAQKDRGQARRKSIDVLLSDDRIPNRFKNIVDIINSEGGYTLDGAQTTHLENVQAGDRDFAKVQKVLRENLRMKAELAEKKLRELEETSRAREEELARQLTQREALVDDAKQDLAEAKARGEEDAPVASVLPDDLELIRRAELTFALGKDDDIAEEVGVQLSVLLRKPIDETTATLSKIVVERDDEDNFTQEQRSPEQCEEILRRLLSAVKNPESIDDSNVLIDEDVIAKRIFELLGKGYTASKATKAEFKTEIEIIRQIFVKSSAEKIPEQTPVQSSPDKAATSETAPVVESSTSTISTDERASVASEVAESVAPEVAATPETSPATAAENVPQKTETAAAPAAEKKTADRAQGNAPSVKSRIRGVKKRAEDKARKLADKVLPPLEEDGPAPTPAAKTESEAPVVEQVPVTKQEPKSPAAKTGDGNAPSSKGGVGENPIGIGSTSSSAPTVEQRLVGLQPDHAKYLLYIEKKIAQGQPLSPVEQQALAGPKLIPYRQRADAMAAGDVNAIVATLIEAGDPESLGLIFKLTAEGYELQSHDRKALRELKKSIDPTDFRQAIIDKTLKPQTIQNSTSNPGADRELGDR